MEAEAPQAVIDAAPSMPLWAVALMCVLFVLLAVGLLAWIVLDKQRVKHFATVWQTLHGTAVTFAGLALWFGFSTLDWISTRQSLTNDNLMLLLGLLIGYLIGSFAGIASARATPVPEPSVPADIHERAVAALAERQRPDLGPAIRHAADKLDSEIETATKGVSQ